MKVLVACEFSGIVREAFNKRGHNAWSCDIEPDLNNSIWHIQKDVREILSDDWDLMIAHPPCTYLCNFGVRWLYKDGRPDVTRWNKLYEARGFFWDLVTHDIPKLCIENPIPHKHADLPKYDQIIHPWQFGHGETKATCLWLRNLPKLKPTNIVSGRENRIHKMPPSKNRGKLRSITYQGIANAMAEQWG